MSQALHDGQGLAEPSRRIPWPVWLILAVLGLLVLVSTGAEWYARQVSLPRYCGELEAALARLEALHSAPGRLLTESRRDYMVAAKLEFLLPRGSGESAGAYHARLRDELRNQCRRGGLVGQNSLFLRVGPYGPQICHAGLYASDPPPVHPISEV